MTGVLHLILIAATLSTRNAEPVLLHDAYCVERFSPSKGVQMVLVVKRDFQSIIGTVDLHGLGSYDQHVRGSAMFNSSLPTLVLFEDSSLSLSHFAWQMKIPKSFLERGDIIYSPYHMGPYSSDVIILGDDFNKLSFSNTACNVSLLDQDFCSHNGYKVTFGSEARLSNVGAKYDSTCTISQDGRELGKFDMYLSESDYSFDGFSISLIKTPHTNFTKLLEAFDPNSEDWLKRIGKFIKPSQESYWTGGRALAYDFLDRYLKIQLTDDYSLPFVAC